MTVFHQLLKWLCSTEFKNDCVPHEWEKPRNDYVPPNWENVLEMTVFHQIEKSFRKDCVPQNSKMTVFHQIVKSLRNDSVPPTFKMTVFHRI